MDKTFLSIRNILDIVFKITKKNANILADCYLIKDSSIISKWKNNRARPKNEDLYKIADFAHEESTGTQRKMIRNEIEILIYNSSLKEEIKESLLRIAEFREFLVEVLNVSTSSVGKTPKQNKLIVQPSEDCEFDRVSNSETITAFHNSLEGNYSGVVEFNLVLSKNGEDGRKGTLSGVADYRTNISRSIKSRMGNLQKQIKSKSVLGTVLIVIITGFMVVQATNSNQNSKMTIPSVKSVEESGDMSNFNYDSLRLTDESLLNVPTQANTAADEFEEVFDDAESDTQETLDTINIEVTTDTAIEKETCTAMDVAIGTATDTKINATTDEPANTTANAATTIINNSVVVEGDNNILGQGSNIIINIGD